MESVDKAAGEGGVITPDKLKGLKKSLGSGKYSDNAELSGARSAYRNLESKVTNAVASQDPSRFAGIKAMQAKADLADVVSNALKAELEVPVAGSSVDAFKSALGDAGSFHVALSLSAALGGHFTGIAALAGRAALKAASNAVHRAVPTIAAGEAISQRIASVQNEVNISARSVAMSLVNDRFNQSGARPKPPTREEFNKYMEAARGLSQKAMEVDGLRRVDDGLHQAVQNQLTVMSTNAESQLAKAGIKTKGGNDSAFGDTSLSKLFGGEAHKPKTLQPGELVAWEYVSTMLEPMKTVQAMRNHKVSPMALQSLRENYPDIMAKLQDSIVEHIVKSQPKGVLSMDTKAYMARILGKPIDTVTSKEFSNSVQASMQAQQEPPPKQGGGSSGNGDGSQVTESERIEG
jgi:hypothetical protein